MKGRHLFYFHNNVTKMILRLSRHTIICIFYCIIIWNLLYECCKMVKIHLQLLLSLIIYNKNSLNRELWNIFVFLLQKMKNIALKSLDLWRLRRIFCCKDRIFQLKCKIRRNVTLFQFKWFYFYRFWRVFPQSSSFQMSESGNNQTPLTKATTKRKTNRKRSSKIKALSNYNRMEISPKKFKCFSLFWPNGNTSRTPPNATFILKVFLEWNSLFFHRIFVKIKLYCKKTRRKTLRLTRETRMKRKREGSKEAKSEPFQNQSLFWGNLTNENILFVQLLWIFF